MPTFDRFIGIDWSGAKGPRLRGLQVAVCERGTAAPRLVQNPNGGYWRRSHLADWLVDQVRQGQVLVGLDFAFAYPFCDRGAYFPGHPESPPDILSLWATVDDLSAQAPDLYAGPFYTDSTAKFADYLCYQTYTGAKFDNRRLRATEELCFQLGQRPSCVFKCVGGDGVGAGSLAGMRLLHLLSTQHPELVSIWPIDSLRERTATLVEIFPRWFFHLAGQNPRQWADPDVVNRTLRFYQSDPLPGGQSFTTEDEVDAVLSAAALRFLADDESIWNPTEMEGCFARCEGWIFGVDAAHDEEFNERPDWWSEHLEQLESQYFPDGFTLRDEANAIVAMAFRNGPLEDLHAGEWSKLLENERLSRITDEEMKQLMIFACEQVASLLCAKETDPEGYYKAMMGYNRMYCRRWER